MLKIKNTEINQAQDLLFVTLVQYYSENCVLIYYVSVAIGCCFYNTVFLKHSLMVYQIEIFVFIYVCNIFKNIFTLLSSLLNF